MEPAPPPPEASSPSHLHELLEEAQAAGRHLHLLSELQEDALCWTVGCFVVAAIAFAVWARHTAARIRPRHMPRSGSFTKRRRRRKPRRRAAAEK